VIAVAATVVIFLGVVGVVSLMSRSNTPTLVGASSSSISFSSTGQALTTNSTSTGSSVGSSTSSASSQSSSSSPSHAGLYELDFVQQERCSYGGWVYPWGVTLNGSKSQTMVQPSNETLGSQYNNDPNNGSYSQIVFWVPNGVYNYTVLPSGSFSQSGTVTIRDNGTSTNVYQYFLAEGCTSSTSVSTSTSSAENP
jgi:hypothetical protein